MISQAAHRGLATIALCAVLLLVATARSANSDSKPEPGRPAMPHGPCVGVAAVSARDGDTLVFRAFEDGTVEERRPAGAEGGKIVYTWKPALKPAF